MGAVYLLEVCNINLANILRLFFVRFLRKWAGLMAGFLDK